MGDVGSATLGFLLATIPLHLPESVRGTALFSVAIGLWFFLSDGTFTLLRRLLRGERVWTPHRSHLYQRLVKSGLRHHQVVIVVMSAAAVLVILTMVAKQAERPNAQWTVLVVAGAAFLAYLQWTRELEKRAVSPNLDRAMPENKSDAKSSRETPTRSPSKST
jgi:hypothetical protein